MKHPVTRTLSQLALATSIASLLACSDSSDSNSGAEPPQGPDAPATFSAQVYRTDGGIPHIVADDWASLGYGTGYAAAEDHYCEQARNILKFRAQLSENFGVGVGNDNLHSDLFIALQVADGLYDAEIDPEFDALFAGYAAGFNRYTRDNGDSISDPACADANWIPTVTADDIRRIHLTPAFLPNVGFMIAQGTPPVPVASADTGDNTIIGSTRSAPTVAVQPAEQQQLAGWIHDIHNPYDKGSNGAAIGREMSADDHGLLFTNPHLDWGSFDFRMYGLHQIIPGVTNMLGANQAQRANVGFGTNGDVAWTNTVSQGVFFAFFRLQLVPGNPTSYIVDGEVREMTPVPVTIKVKDAEGVISDYNHTGYKSHIGWVAGGPLAWTSEKADTIASADEGARGFQGGALAMSRATNVRELKGIIDKYANFPSTNVIAADSAGETLYGDLAPTANWTDEQLVECNLFGPIYDGSTSACEWGTDPDSAAPGLLGASKQPYLYRYDYVTNSNDSYWLANPAEPIPPAPMVKGDSGTERTMRTRAGLMMIEARRHGSDGLPGTTFDLDSLIARSLNNDSGAAMLLGDGLVQLCRDNPSVELDGETVNVSAACDVLAAWDRTANLESRGAHLFREIMRTVTGNYDGRNIPPNINVLVPFDANDPLATPRGLDSEDNPDVLLALATAVRDLNDRGIALDAQLGELQGVTRNGQFIPLHGGEEIEGVFNKMSFDPVDGRYPEVTGSSASWVMAAHVAGDDTRVKGLTAFSQSSDPTSEHYSDLTQRFSDKDLPEIPFLLADVQAQATSSMTLEEGEDDCVGDGWQQFSAPGVSDEASCREFFQRAYNNRITGFVED